MIVSVRRPRKSIFSSPTRSTVGPSNCVIMGILARRFVQRQKVGERLVGHDDPGCVYADVAGDALEPATDIDHTPYRGVLVVLLLEFRFLLEGLVKRHFSSAGTSCVSLFA